MPALHVLALHGGTWLWLVLGHPLPHLDAGQQCALQTDWLTPTVASTCSPYCNPLHCDYWLNVINWPHYLPRAEPCIAVGGPWSPVAVTTSLSWSVVGGGFKANACHNGVSWVNWEEFASWIAFHTTGEFHGANDLMGHFTYVVCATKASIPQSHTNFPSFPSSLVVRGMPYGN